MSGLWFLFLSLGALGLIDDMLKIKQKIQVDLNQDINFLAK